VETEEEKNNQRYQRGNERINRQLKPACRWQVAKIYQKMQLTDTLNRAEKDTLSKALGS
jgi:hypothetical protein